MANSVVTLKSDNGRSEEAIDQQLNFVSDDVAHILYQLLVQNGIENLKNFQAESLVPNLANILVKASAGSGKTWVGVLHLIGDILQTMKDESRACGRLGAVAVPTLNLRKHWKKMLDQYVEIVNQLSPNQLKVVELDDRSNRQKIEEVKKASLQGMGVILVGRTGNIKFFTSDIYQKHRDKPRSDNGKANLVRLVIDEADQMLSRVRKENVYQDMMEMVYQTLNLSQGSDGVAVDSRLGRSRTKFTVMSATINQETEETFQTICNFNGKQGLVLEVDNVVDRLIPLFFNIESNQLYEYDGRIYPSFQHSVCQWLYHMLSEGGLCHNLKTMIITDGYSNLGKYKDFLRQKFKSGIADNIEVFEKSPCSIHLVSLEECLGVDVPSTQAVLFTNVPKNPEDFVKALHAARRSGRNLAGVTCFAIPQLITSDQMVIHYKENPGDKEDIQRVVRKGEHSFFEVAHWQRKHNINFIRYLEQAEDPILPKNGQFEENSDNFRSDYTSMAGLKRMINAGGVIAVNCPKRIE
jgi:superfamily II DNA/RNA helicase